MFRFSLRAFGILPASAVLLAAGISARAQNTPLPAPTPPQNPPAPAANIPSAAPPAANPSVAPTPAATPPPPKRSFSLLPPDAALPQPTPGVRPTMPPSTASRRPDLFAPLPFYTNRDNYFFAGAADLRYRTLTSSQTHQTIGTYIAATRFTGDYIRANPRTGDERGGVRLQILLESDNQGTRLDRVRPSEAYGFYRFLFPGVSANLRAGQFVLPFGLIAVWDTPLQPIQPLYEKALGLRVDTGFMLEGDYGPYHYAGSVTTGSGPNRTDVDWSRVLAFRLERTFPTSLGQFQLGGSLLSGRTPRTAFNTLLPASGYTRAGKQDMVSRTRFAADGQYLFGPVTARGEIIFGSDEQDAVWGYFAEGELAVTNRLRPVAFVRRWNFPQKPEGATTLAAGLFYDVPYQRYLFTIRTLFEYERNTPLPAGTPAEVIRRLTVQTRLNF